MQRKQAYQLSKVMAFAMGLGVVIGCKKIKCDEPAPVLYYDTLMLDASRENLIYQTEFEDCQGDIGNPEGVDSGSEIRTYLFERIDGRWVQWYPDTIANPNVDTTTLFKSIPASEKNREGWLLKGTIIQTFNLIQLYQGNDTIRFESVIFDRAGNRSNRVQSVPFVFPPF